MNGFDIHAVRSSLPGRTIDYYPEIGSTMTAAAKLVDHGAVVVADSQTAGIGRYNRAWHSAPGDGLYFTVVLRTDPLPLLTMAIGLAVQEAIAHQTGLAPDIRWPNDLLARERKLCGILTQYQDQRVLAGIGINVNHEAFPPELESLATSIRLETGRAYSREALLIDVLQRMDTFSALPHPAILTAFTQQSSYARGRRVCVELNGREVRGVTAGLDKNGYLLLDDSEGHRHTILAGGVRPCS